MTAEPPRPIGAADQGRILVAAARSGGLVPLMQALNRAVGAEVALFDNAGSALAASPNRTLWDFDRIRAAVLRQLRPQNIVARRVELDGETVAFLAVNSETDPGTVLDIAIDLIVMEISRLNALHQGRRDLAGTLLNDIIENRISEQDARSRLRGIDVDIATPHRILLGWAQMSDQRRRRLTWGSGFAMVSEHQEPYLRLIRGEYLLTIVPDDPMVDRIAQTVHAQLADLGEDATVGVSLPHVGSPGLRVAFFEALSATRQGAGVQYPERIDLTQLVVVAGTSVPLPEFARATLLPLIDYDLAHGSALVKTLESYVRCNRNVPETTEQLFIHRNTLRYRLRQIEELLGVNIDDTATIATLWLAFTTLNDAADPTRITP